MPRRPSWACDAFKTHGEFAVCPQCIRNFEAQGAALATWDHGSPRVEFSRGWLTTSSTHLFAGTAATVFRALDRSRLLAQAACGGIIDVTLVRAPVPSRQCGKCLSVIRRVELPVDPRRPHAVVAADPAIHGVAPQSRDLIRLYRGLKEPYDPARVHDDNRFGTDFTDCLYQALLYAAGRRGVLLIVEVPEDLRRMSEETWIGGQVRRFQIRGKFDEFLIAQIPAKDLRAHLRRRGVSSGPLGDRVVVLESYLASLRAPSLH